MNMSFTQRVAGVFAGSLLTVSLATGASAAPLSVATHALVAPSSQIVEARYVSHHRIVRHYRGFPGIGPVIGGLLAFGLGATFRPSCDDYYYDYPYYGYPSYCGPYYSEPYYYGPSYGYVYRPGFRRHVFLGGHGVFRSRTFAAAPGRLVGFRPGISGGGRGFEGMRGGGGPGRGGGHHR